MLLPALSIASAPIAHHAPFPHPAHRTGRADFPHPALGQRLIQADRPRSAAENSGGTVELEQAQLLVQVTVWVP